VDDIRERGWTQGSVLHLPNDLAKGNSLMADRSYIVISHPCDVVSVDFKRDPKVELVPIIGIDRLDGNFTFGKNPRVLHIAVDSAPVSLVASDRVQIDRLSLAGVDPRTTISESDRRLLASWLASRYARSIFADEFNERMRSARNLTETILKRSGAHISGIYLETSIDELPDGTDYELVMIVTMESADFGDNEKWVEVSSAVDEISDAVKAQAGIHLLACELLSERDMSVERFRTYARWDYDALSFKTGDEGSVPAHS
jgi:hypothetical protein